jgi:hypothetical protein
MSVKLFDASAAVADNLPSQIRNGEWLPSSGAAERLFHKT